MIKKHRVKKSTLGNSSKKFIPKIQKIRTNQQNEKELIEMRWINLKTGKTGYFTLEEVEQIIESLDEYKKGNYKHFTNYEDLIKDLHDDESM